VLAHWKELWTCKNLATLGSDVEIHDESIGHNAVPEFIANLEEIRTKKRDSDGNEHVTVTY